MHLSLHLLCDILSLNLHNSPVRVTCPRSHRKYSKMNLGIINSENTNVFKNPQFLKGGSKVTYPCHLVSYSMKF